jgi:ABC-type nitrate/sulfonate/bicarbonate transport system permease component
VRFDPVKDFAPISIVAIAPLLVVGLGFGALPKVLVVALVTFFPIVVSTVDGLRATDRDMLRLFQAMNAGYWRTLRLLRIPAALPAIFTGVKIAVTYSVIGAVFAEWIGASAGLGVFIARSVRAFRTDQVFVAAIVTSLLTIVLFTITAALQRWLIPWEGQEQ